MVSIQLDKGRHLLRTFPGMKLFEEKTGKSMLTGFNVDDCKVEDFIALLWSLLIHEDENLTYEMVEEIVKTVDAVEIIKQIAETLKG